MTAGAALMAALAAALRADAGVGGGGAGVFELQPAPGAKPPFVTVGPDIATDWGSKTTDGREHRLRVSAFADRPGEVLLPLMERIEAVALSLEPALDGHRIVSLRLLRTLVNPSADGGPSEGIIEFRARTERA